MNPLPMLIALWRAIVQVVVDVFSSEEDPPVPESKRDPAASRERRRRNARRREMRALRTRRCRHGRQARTGPRSRQRLCSQPASLLAPIVETDLAARAARAQEALEAPVVSCESRQGDALEDQLDAPAALDLEASIEVIEVRRNRSGEGWEAVPRGHRRAPLCASQEAAIAAARERLSEGTGGEILLLNDTGKVTKTIPVLGEAARELCPHLDSERAEALSAA